LHRRRPPYRIGSFHDAWIDPGGYPGGGPREYNFRNEPFRSAAHGAGMALIAGGDAQQGLVVAPCNAIVARVGGQLVVGLNDNDPGNNTGQVSSSVRLRPASPMEWSSQRTNPCGLR
jgi:hypothetical protein